MTPVLKFTLAFPALLLVTALPTLAQDGVAKAQANIDAYSGLPTFVAAGEPLDAKDDGMSEPGGGSGVVAIPKTRARKPKAVENPEPSA